MSWWAVNLAEVKGVEIDGLETADLQGISEHFGEDVMGVFDITAALEARRVVGVRHWRLWRGS